MPALVLIPVLLVLPQLIHGGGWELVGQFAMAAVQPSLDPVVIAGLPARVRVLQQRRRREQECAPAFSGVRLPARA